MSLWNHLPSKAIEQQAHTNARDQRCAAAIKAIDKAIAALHECDPSMYYDGDINALLDQRMAMTRLLSEES